MLYSNTYWKIKALNNVHSLVVLFIEITGAWPRPPAQKAVVMETAQDANLTTTDIQTRRDTLSPALPHQNTVYSRGQICSVSPLAGLGCVLQWGGNAFGSSSTWPLHPKNCLGKTSSDTTPKRILCFQCLLRCDKRKRRPPFLMARTENLIPDLSQCH